ncbi:hypothetical protein AKJ09_09515 [Labilithrix luteola]|uniref:Uncharacterized protein n=1 Tax=Labilithrix luteola TaxID=1391654 RepID=A0A0K1QB11_9BACT|nr:hypothetical protein [Labilithrix luteola]AKV02852.1 hypothetical protein AKJ09_09515 [Labilithrix luteola]
MNRQRRRESDWALVVSFWAFSLLFGIGAAITGWGLAMILAWVMLAVAAVSAMTHTGDGDERLFH